jgi:putative ABC transport system permease protein
MRSCLPLYFVATFVQDLQYALRVLRGSPGFTGVAVLALGLGIGANTAIFSVVNSVLLKPLPFAKSEQIVFVLNHYPQGALGKDAPLSPPQVTDFGSLTDTFEKFAVYRNRDVNLSTNGVPERVQGAAVTGEYFEVFRIQPAAGRLLGPEDAQAGRERVVALSDALWRDRFGRNRAAIGSDITLNGQKHTIVGVVPASFALQQRTQLWMPLVFTPEQLSPAGRGAQGFPALARLREGVSIAAASERLKAMAPRLVQDFPDFYPAKGEWIPRVASAAGFLVREVELSLWVLLGAVGLVLLIACVNIANLMLARAAARQREIAVRSALGASRRRVVQQLLTESTLLALMGGSLGVLFASWGVDAARSVSIAPLPRTGEIAIDAGVLMFTLTVSIAVGLLFGLAPAMHAAHADVADALKEGGRSGASSRSRQRINRILVVLELALAIVMLIGAALMVRTLIELQRIDLGFDTRNTLTARISLPAERYNRDQRLQFFRTAVERVAALPGVIAAGATDTLPLTNTRSASTFEREDRPLAKGVLGPVAEVRSITPGYFSAMRIPLRAGRQFTDADIENTPRVAIIDETLAREHWPGENPVGKRITREERSQQNWVTIVGVVGFTRHRELTQPVKGILYAPAAQGDSPAMTLVLRTSVPPQSITNALRSEIRALDREQPVWDVMTLDERLYESTAPQRYVATLLGAFAVVALLLAALGIYGVMAYGVTQRRHEIGIRLALGAARRDVLRLMVAQGLALAAVGVGVGLAGALALTRVLRTLLYGVAPYDAWTYLIVAATLAAVTVLASYIPAARATRLDPSEALRYE